MRVLFLAPQPFFRLRGMCLAVRRCLEIYSQLGAEVDLLTFPFGEDIALPGLHVHRLRPLPGVRDVPIGPSWRKAAMDVPLFFAAAGLCLRRRYDLLHASEESVLIGAALRTISDACLVADMDEVLSDRLARSGFISSEAVLGLVRRAERWALSRADAVLTNSEDTTAYARDHARRSWIGFYEHLPPLPTESWSTEERLAVRGREGWQGRDVVLYAGNLETYQGVELLVDALPELRRLRPSVLCVVVGGRPEQIERLRLRARARDVSDILVASGPRPFDATFGLMRAADTLVSPVVEFKAVPMKLYSYLAAGTPIVATDVPNHAQILERSALAAPRADAFAVAIAETLARRPVPRLTRRPPLSGRDAIAAIRHVMALAAAR